jgi:hypothetical protein
MFSHVAVTEWNIFLLLSYQGDKDGKYDQFVPLMTLSDPAGRPLMAVPPFLSRR